MQKSHNPPESWCGTYRVSIDDLQTATDAASQTCLDEQKLRRLVVDFHHRGCLHSQVEHRLTGQAVLSHEAPSRETLRAQSLMSSAGAPIPVWPRHWGSIYVLDGRHRLAAARRFWCTKPDQPLWTVEIHAINFWRGIPAGLSLRQYLLAVRTGDRVQQETWLSRLTKTQRSDIGRWESLGEVVKSAVYDLLPYECLWSAIKICALRDLQRLNGCPEMLHNGLCLIRKTYEHMLAAAQCRPEDIGADDVELLQGKCPTRSVADRDLVIENLKSGHLLRRISETHRAVVLHVGIMTIPHLIPSLYLFLENVKFMALGAASLDAISRPVHRETPPSTLEMRFRSCYRSNLASSVPDPASRVSRTRTSESDEQAFKMAYHQVWLHALRNFPYLRRQQPRKSSGSGPSTRSGTLQRGWSGSVTSGSNDTRALWLQDLARFAGRVGFSLPSGYEWSMNTSVAQIANILQQCPIGYHVGRAILESHVRTLHDALQRHAAEADTTEESVECIVRGCEVRDRCGVPLDSVFWPSRGTLTYSSVFESARADQPNLNNTRAEFVNTGFCLRFAIRSFLLTPEDNYECYR